MSVWQDAYDWTICGMCGQASATRFYGIAYLHYYQLCTNCCLHYAPQKLIEQFTLFDAVQ